MENPEKKGFGLRDSGFGIKYMGFCIPEARIRMPDSLPRALTHSFTVSMQEAQT
jgi:hypothetical protein